MQLLPLTWHFPSSTKFRHNYCNLGGILLVERTLKVILFSEFLLIINSGVLSHVIYHKAKSSHLAAGTTRTAEVHERW